MFILFVLLQVNINKHMVGLIEKIEVKLIIQTSYYLFLRIIFLLIVVTDQFSRFNS